MPCLSFVCVSFLLEFVWIMASAGFVGLWFWLAQAGFVGLWLWLAAAGFVGLCPRLGLSVYVSGGVFWIMALAGFVGLRLETFGVWDFWVVFWSSTLDASDLLGVWASSSPLLTFDYFFCTSSVSCVATVLAAKQTHTRKTTRKQ